MLTITTFGRLGNIIFQILNCICYSLSFDNPEKINLKLLKEYNKPNLDFLPDYIFENDTVNIKDTFWNYSEYREKYISNSIPIIQTIFKSFIDINLNLNIDLNDTLVIHFRGGDTFLPQYINSWKQMPYYFYKNIIDKNNYKHILLVVEDLINPVINKLKENYSNIIITHNTNYMIDFLILCKSINLVNSMNSTFLLTSLFLNNSVKNIYTFKDSNISYLNNNINIIEYDMSYYLNKLNFKDNIDYFNYLILEKEPNI